MVAFDPSCVSSSLPGYALMDGLDVIEYGVLDINKSGRLPIRLQRLHGDLISEFVTRADVVAVEEVPFRPIRTKKQASQTGKTFMTQQSIHSLAQAVGIFKGSFPVGTPILDVSPLVWQSYARRYKWPWEKSDSGDAYMILLTVRQIYLELTKKGGIE